VDSLLTVDEAAEVMGTPARFIRRLIAERRIAYTKHGTSRVAESDLMKYVAASRAALQLRRWELASAGMDGSDDGRPREYAPLAGQADPPIEARQRALILVGLQAHPRPHPMQVQHHT
jgi:excisionase family DNA binding protein